MWSKIFTTVKYLLVSVNLVSLVAGIIILSVGSSVQSSYNQYHEFLSERFFSLPAFCIATGIIIFLIGFIGFYGAYMENYYMNLTFAGFMIVIFIFQFSACIAGFVLKGQTVPLIQVKLTDTMELYGADKNYEVTKQWDEVQTDFTCCGVKNSSDWLIPLNDVLPVSCCSHVYGTIGTFTCNGTTAYKTGCADAFGDWVQSHVRAIGVSGIFLVLLQGLAVAGAVWMAKILREEQFIP